MALTEAGGAGKGQVLIMVAVLSRTDVTPEQHKAVYSVLRSPGMKTPAQVASETGLDREAVAAFLAAEAQMGRIDCTYGRYVTWD